MRKAKAGMRRNSGGYKVLITKNGEHAGVLGPYYGSNALQMATDDAEGFRAQAAPGVAVEVVPTGARRNQGGRRRRRRGGVEGALERLERALSNPIGTTVASAAGMVVQTPHGRGEPYPHIGNPPSKRRRRRKKRSA